MLLALYGMIEEALCKNPPSVLMNLTGATLAIVFDGFPFKAEKINGEVRYFAPHSSALS